MNMEFHAGILISFSKILIIPRDEKSDIFKVSEAADITPFVWLSQDLLGEDHKKIFLAMGEGRVYANQRLVAYPGGV